MTYDTKQVMVTGLKSLVVLFLLLTTGMSGVWGQTSITSLSQITDENGNYIISGDISGGTPGVSTFNGTLEAAINPSTKMPYRITGLSVPLFTTLTGTVKNIVLEGVSISSGDNDGNTGAIACTANGAARIYNVGILSGSVGGTGDTGGLVGAISGTARVINCYSFADITSGDNVGGIVGNNKETTNSDAANLKTMVMNCMFYGDITGGTTKSPIYGGTIINNKDGKGVGNYNYFRLEAPYVQPTGITYNCALGAEDRFLQRFEFYRHLLNSHRELAGWWATGDFSKEEMLKWVFEPSQIGSATPYPILKAPGRYHSVVNIDVLDVENKKSNTIGTTMETLTVKIQMGNGGAVYGPPTGAAITTQQLTLNITDKDPDHFNFNYYKVQLPYYNDVGTKNYTGNRVVTGWKIVNIIGGTPGSFTTGDDAPAYNFADRNCTNKDLYGAGGSNRIFNQGAYWDVPEGVTEITIEPYWAKCVYLADPSADKVYNTAMTTGYNVPRVGGGQIYTNGNKYNLATHSLDETNGQVVYTTMGNAISSSAGTALYVGVSETDRNNQSVYDYAVVLVGNYHHYNSMESTNSKPYTVTSIDLDGDNEPDYSYILRFDSRTPIHPVRVDFINIPGLGMAQKSTGGTGSYNFGILQPKNWFESTNTSLFRVTQFEYDAGRDFNLPYIVQGGVFEQWVGGQNTAHKNKITYFHVGGNVWFKEFHRGCHQDKQHTTKHPPVSVTGGDYDEFYLTGLYRGDVNSYADNAECYINGGRFGTVAGAAMEGINGDITWQVQNADIKEFFAGGINAAKPVTGNLSTTITGGHIELFCGGPKFGDMSANKTVTTTATGCTFGTFFGAGYGGNSYSRQAPRNHNNIVNFPHNDTGNPSAGNDDSWNAWLARFYKQEYSSSYGGVSTQFNYQFLPMSGNADNVARIFVEYVKFSLATTRNVTSTLTGCTITNNFYGGGSLGKVDGSVTSTLDGCTVNGSAFGAGFSASLPTVEVDDKSGFEVEPYYYEQLGTYRTGVKKPTTTYTWEHRNTVNDTETAINTTDHILYTTEDLNALGTVSGDVILNVTGNTLVEGKVFDRNGNVIEQTGGVFGGGDESKVTGTNKTVTVNINQTGGSATRYLNNVFGGGNKGDVASDVQVTVQGSSFVSNNVFGGGNLADVGGSVTVNMNSGTVVKDVYGGGALANTNINNVTAGYGTASETIPNTTTKTTTVNLTGGTIMGDAYGGGLGRIGVTAVTGEHFTQEEIDAAQEGDPAFGKTTEDWKVQPVEGVEGVEALVYGDVTVTENGTAFVKSTTNDDKGNEVVTAGRIFGCNNLNGSPQGTVLVLVEETARADGEDHKKSEYNEDGSLKTYNYEVQAVYGGGNLAPYEPKNPNATGQYAEKDHVATKKPVQVVIDGCEDVSVEYVYGGGNAAPTPSTDLLIYGAFELGSVFGGGNGKDRYTVNGGTTWNINPGADVGINNETDYGTGDANTTIYGGIIHEVYGASNQKGRIIGSINLLVEENEAQSDCYMEIGKIVGAGKNADIDQDVNLVMGCMPETKTDLVFAGADNANVNGHVELTITSGTFGKVFGGNNLGGIIKGYIKVNIEETGCTPIKIDELYLGGNQAAYSIFGYYDSGETLPDGRVKYLPRTSATDEHLPVKLDGTNYATIDEFTNYDQPVLNVISCTYIGKVFGGGLGTGAAMYADPTVNINMIQGEYADNLPVDINNPNKLGAVENVYGGGNLAAVHGNTTVNIGTEIGNDIVLNSPENETEENRTKQVLGAYITGTVYGAGKGVETDPNAAIVTGNTRVNMAGGLIKRSIYGGGELSSVGTFETYYTETIGNDDQSDYHVKGEPKTCAENTGLTEVIISGGQVGLVNQLMPDPANPTSDDDYGYVFCAGKGIADPTEQNEDDVPYANLLAVSGSSHLEITGGLVAASVYGGSENGQVLGNTFVEIKDGQIGSGHYKEGDTHHWDPIYTEDQWTTAINKIKDGTFTDADAAPFHECDSWPFGPEGERHVYDHFAEYKYNGEYYYDEAHQQPSYGGSKSGSDGHSYYGHVFGGGSGYYPYAPGQWRRTAGRVNGNTEVKITGGHILTNVYGGNEITDVLGSSKVHMTGGTVGVPRTLAGIQARPVNSYIFGAGMGDPRVIFNGWSNVASAEVIVEGDAVVFGSVFGGGEDGHILGNVSTTIQGDALIGTFGSSGVDGNIFGSGRGFSTLALTAGAVCGNVEVKIAENAKILGSVFGGGRMAAVGIHLVAEGTANYGVLIPDGKNQVLGGDDVDAAGATHGYVTINITGGTIGNPSQLATSQFSIGDVFGGSKGIFLNGEWTKSQKLGLVKNTTVNISQAEDSTTTIYGNVYGGGEIASVGSYSYATTDDNTLSEPIKVGDVNGMLEDNTGKATISITGGTIGQNSLADTNGNVFGGCLGMAGPTYSGYSFVNNSEVTLNGGTVYGSIFGGGENGHIFHDTDVKVKSGTVGIPLHDKVIADLSDAEKDNMIYRGNVYGGGRGVDPVDGGGYSITAGKVAGNTNVTVEGGTIYRNVYGGGSLASVGNRDEQPQTDGSFLTGLATVTIKGGQIGTDGGQSADVYTTNGPTREPLKENGGVFGSGRGLAAGADATSVLVQLAYTKNTEVYIQDDGIVTGSVFGGGENGHVKYDTKVYVRGGTVGTELTEEEHRIFLDNPNTPEVEAIDDNGRGLVVYRGNVYGGGRGIDKAGDYYSLTAGRVYGNTYVEVSGGKIYHDVFGGGSLASVGNETIDETTGEVSYRDDSGETEVRIKGGVIGYSATHPELQGFNCGFVYGGCRGLSADPESEIVQMAYVHDTKVYIEDEADIKGSVFGGGANGHVKNDTYVEISGGSIGSKLNADELGLDEHGVASKSVYRGNVYAGGRGVDVYQKAGSDLYSLTAGAVYGNAELLMTGGHVWHNIYGSGAMASVGTVQSKAEGQHVHDEIVDASNVIQNPDNELNYLTGVFKDGTGKVTLTITGGTVGDTTPGQEGINNGNVFGAGRGVSANRNDIVSGMEFVNMAEVTIGTSGQTSYTGTDPEKLNYPYIYGNVYGGGENGHVKTDTDVRIYSGIIGWPLVEGEGQIYKEGADGSAKNPYRGHVFGGGCGVDPLYHGDTEERSATAGRVYGHTNVTMTGGVVRRAIYGGGMLASVGVYRLLNTDMHIIDMIEDEVNAGDATVTVSGGYIGNVDANGNALGTGYLAPGDNNGFVYGSSCGMVADVFEEGGQQNTDNIQYRQMGYTHSTHVGISDGHIFGCVFGSGENGHVWEDAIVNISGGEIGSEGNDSKYVGNVYGSGRGVDHPHAHISETAGKVRGNTTVNVTGGTVWRDVYGGGSLASVGEADEEADDGKIKIDDDILKTNPFPYSTGLTRVVIDDNAAVHGSVYGSGRGVASTNTEYKQAAYVKNTLVTVKGNAHVLGNVFGGGNAGHVRKNTDVTIKESAKVDGNVYGGGAGAIESPTAGLVNHDVVINIKGGVIAKDVYGGGAIANTNVHDVRNTAATDCSDDESRGKAKTEVNLLGGIILGDAYGGGQGVIPASTATDAEKANAGAMVQGDVTVTLDGTAFYPTTTTDGVATSGRVFGCNNLNGTPQGTVLVKVLKTVGVTKSGDTYTVKEVEDKPTRNSNIYEVEAVYGGGNLAAYEPWDANATGQYTYSGRISPANNPLQVVIDGCEETSIDYVYGGGNAASTPSTQVTILGTYEIGTVFGGGNGKDALPNGDENPGAHVGYKADGTTPYANASGNANVYLFGGTIHETFGGSNTKGSILGKAEMHINEVKNSTTGKAVCPLILDEAYGGGNVAYMEGGTEIELGCITSLKTLYGGARNANVGGDINMTITSGHFDRVFGGNNLGGTISGSITVNIEETGCNPITIGELYGCGNQAPYSTPSGKTDPTINVKSFTSIGRIFGGGLGTAAVVTGNPTVNINEVKGENANNTTWDYHQKTVDGKLVGNVIEYHDNASDPTEVTSSVTMPTHETGKIGAIGTVFGGGNAAEVNGGTHVNIGTESTVTFESIDDDETTTENEKVKNVEGVDIRGDVFGGGNQADVTGKTNVIIGQ